MRGWEKGATEADIPVFLVDGVNDNAARVAAMEWFTRRGGREGDKLWLGQWDHGSGCCPTRRGSSGGMPCTRGSTSSSRSARSTPVRRWSCSCLTGRSRARQGDRTEVLASKAWPGQPERVTFDPTADEGLGRAVVQATPMLAAGIDLYLQRRNADGSWSGDIASGVSGELTGETMTTTRLGPRTYRIEVHNWAGPAANQVAVKGTFYNSAGEPGT